MSTKYRYPNRRLLVLKTNVDLDTTFLLTHSCGTQGHVVGFDSKRGDFDACELLAALADGGDIVIEDGGAARLEAFDDLPFRLGGLLQRAEALQVLGINGRDDADVCATD